MRKWRSDPLMGAGPNERSGAMASRQCEAGMPGHAKQSHNEGELERVARPTFLLLRRHAAERACEGDGRGQRRGAAAACMQACGLHLFRAIAPTWTPTRQERATRYAAPHHTTHAAATTYACIRAGTAPAGRARPPCHHGDAGMQGDPWVGPPHLGGHARSSWGCARAPAVTVLQTAW